MKIYIDDRNISLPDNVVSEGEDFQVFIETKMNRELTENVVVQQQGAKSRNHGVTYMIIGQVILARFLNLLLHLIERGIVISLLKRTSNQLRFGI